MRAPPKVLRAFDAYVIKWAVPVKGMRVANLLYVIKYDPYIIFPFLKLMVEFSRLKFGQDKHCSNISLFSFNPGCMSFCTCERGMSVSDTGSSEAYYEPKLGKVEEMKKSLFFESDLRVEGRCDCKTRCRFRLDTTTTFFFVERLNVE